jgi:uncharacterized protein
MELTPTLPLLAILAAIGVGTGTLGAILGTGGGVFLIPVLVLGFDVPMRFAIGTSILSVIATSTAVAITNVERGTANMRLGMTLEIGTSLGAIVGGLTAGVIPGNALEIIFGLVLIPTALVMWRKRAGDAESAKSATAGPTAVKLPQDAEPPPSLGQLGVGRLGASYSDPALGQEVSYRVQRLWAGWGISVIAGILSGLLGIGGGVFKVPAINLLCGVPIKAAAATSNFMIGVTAAASAFLYLGRGDVQPAMTTAVVLGIVLGSFVGSFLNRYIGGLFVKRLFAVLLIGVAVQLLVRAWMGGHA